MNKRILLFLIISVSFHAVVIRYLNNGGSSPQIQTIKTYREISLLEEKKKEKKTTRVKRINPKINPRVLKLLRKEETHKENIAHIPKGKNIEFKKLDISTDLTKKKKLDLEIEKEPTSITARKENIKFEQEKNQLKLSRTEIGVDIKPNRYHEDLSPEQLDVVIEPPKKTFTTEELLKQAPIELPKVQLNDVVKGEGGYIYGKGKTSTPAPEVSLKKMTISKDITNIKPKKKEATKSTESKIISSNKTNSSGPKISISGEIVNRKIIKKVLPTYPRAALLRGSEGRVILKFWVTPSGKVRSHIIVLKSSGDPDLDAAAQEALLQWVFSKIEGGNDQWGILTVDFVLF